MLETKNKAQRAKSVDRLLGQLVERILPHWQAETGRDGDFALADCQLLESIASSLFNQSLSAESTDPSGPAGFNGPVASLIARLPPGDLEALHMVASDFVETQSSLLLRQGLKHFSRAGLLAFFLSAFYEKMRFNAPPSRTKGGRLSRLKRPGSAYFTPPALAYLAAQQGLDQFFAGRSEALPGLDDLPQICDPAMGTGLYLVAALDYLHSRRPDLSRHFLADRYLSGCDFDAITCGAAQVCLHLAASPGPGTFKNLIWADGLQDDWRGRQSRASGVDREARSDSLPRRFDIVLSNPPWDIVKTAGALSRVNRAKAAQLRVSFTRQGQGDTSWYKLFLERCFQLLAPGGVASLLLPFSFCGDKGAAPLRRLLFEQSSLHSLLGFINEDNSFAIHLQFKYILLTFSRPAIDHSFAFEKTAGFRAKFGLRARLDNLFDDTFFYPLSLVEQIGGKNFVISAFESDAEIAFNRAVYDGNRLFSSLVEASDHNIFFRREFDMTLDRPKLVQATGGSGKPGQMLLPLLEGRQIGPFQVGKASSTAQHFMTCSAYRRRVAAGTVKIGFISISSVFNTRTMIAAILPDLPCGNSLPTLVFKGKDGSEGAGAGDEIGAVEKALFVCGVFNSFVFDCLLRSRMSGTNLSYHLLGDLPVPDFDGLALDLRRAIVALVALLSLKPAGAACGSEQSTNYASFFIPLWRQDSERSGAELAKCLLRYRVWLEVLLLHSYKISGPESDYIFRHCRLPAALLARRRRIDSSGAVDQVSAAPRSFFRVDKELVPDQRLTNLVHDAFSSIELGALSAFLAAGNFDAPLPAHVEAAIEERFATGRVNLLLYDRVVLTDR
ncbi:MAG: N-6 DNA methylase [Cyanobacteria bacterium REEB67]|nr:N-6 DNA methylase [Cyanobacteria bacterium REEB67]